MGVGQVLDMDIVRHAGAVGSRIAVLRRWTRRAFADRRFARHLDEERCVRGRLADARLRIRSRDR